MKKEKKKKIREIQKGDIVVCLPGYEQLGGSGYWPGRIFKVASRTGNVLWPDITFNEVITTNEQTYNRKNGIYVGVVMLSLDSLPGVVDSINQELNS